MDPVVTSSLISAGSKLLGGVLGGKKKRGPDFSDQLAMMGQEIDRRFRATMDAAQNNGIHPLVALGIPNTGGMSFSMGGEQESAPSIDLSGIGQDIGNAVANRQTPDQKAVTGVMTKQAVERGHLENELLKTQIAQARASISPGISTNNVGELIPGQANSSAKAALAKIATPYGHEDGVTPLHKTVYDEAGDPMRVFNEEGIGDSELLSALHGLLYTVPDWLHNKVGKPASKQLTRFIKYKKRLSERRYQ